MGILESFCISKNSVQNIHRIDTYSGTPSTFYAVKFWASWDNIYEYVCCCKRNNDNTLGFRALWDIYDLSIRSYLRLHYIQSYYILWLSRGKL
jgi:hypothetical protein